MKKGKKNKTEQVFDRLLTDKRYRQDVVRKSLEFFFPVYFYKYIKYDTAPFHKEIFSILEDEKNKLAVIVAFRGSAKSTIVTTAHVIWSILGAPQKKFIVILGQTEQKARQNLMNIKEELEHNELLRKDLGPFDEERNQWGATAIIIRKLNAKIMISSVEQSIRGMRHGESRPDLIILDDVEDTSSVKTQEGRDKTFNWLTSEVIPAGDKNTRVIAVGNLLHEDSLLKRLQRKIEDGEMNGVYCEYPIMDENGVSLWPGKYPTPQSIEEERKKVASNVAWAREYLLTIISTDEQIIKNEEILYYDDIPPRARNHDGYFDDQFIVVGVDLAISKNDSADYTAILPILYRRNRERNCHEAFVLRDFVHKRLDFNEVCDAIILLNKTLMVYGARIIFVIETVAYQQAVSQAVKAKDRNYIEVVEKNTTLDKETRLRIAKPMFSNKAVFFPRYDANIIVREITGFGREKHDDLVDGMTLSINYASEALLIENTVICV